MQLITKISVVGLNKNIKEKNNCTMSRIEKLLEYMKTSGKDSFLQHALALEYIKVGDDDEARKLFNE